MFSTFSVTALIVFFLSKGLSPFFVFTDLNEAG